MAAVEEEVAEAVEEEAAAVDLAPAMEIVVIPVNLSIEDASVEEGGTAEFLVSMNAAAGATVTVDFATVDGTAQAGSDYAAASGTLTFAAGETTRTISVPTLDDTVPETQEGFTVVLSNPSGAGLEDDTAVGTITDNELPALSIGNALVEEGETARFEVRLAPSIPQTVTVSYRTADDTATAPDDYTSTSGTLTFTAGQAVRTIPVPTLDDSEQESDERFTLTPEQPLGGHAERRHGRRDDHRQRRRPHHARVVHRKRPGGGRGIGPVRSETEPGRHPDGHGGLCHGRRHGGGARRLHPGSGRLTFAAGETIQSIFVPTLDDSEQEAEERFTVMLSNSSGASLNDNTGEGTIIDNDHPAVLAIDDAPAVVEGGAAEFLVRLIG